MKLNSINNSLISTLLFILYVTTSCYGLYLIKLASTPKSVGFFLGVGFYAAGALIWMIILRLMPLSFVFPIAAGALVIGTMVTGYIFLHEVINWRHIIGAGLILTGILLVGSSR